MPSSKGCTTPVLQKRWTSPDGCGKREIDAGYQRGGWVREQHCCLSSIVVAEIRYGLAKRSAASRLQALTEATLETQEILPWTEACTRFYGQLRFDLERHGKPLAALDLLIASHALSEGCTLVMAGTTTHDRFTPDIVASPGPCPHLQSVDVNPESPNIPVLSSAFRFVGKQVEIERDQPNRCSGPDD